MPIRNPFRRAPGAEAPEEAHRNATDSGFKSTAVSGTQPLHIKDSTEYKLSGEIFRAFRRAHRMLFVRTGAYCSIRNQRQRSVPTCKTYP
jgi:hypothetical protein